MMISLEITLNRVIYKTLKLWGGRYRQMFEEGGVNMFKTKFTLKKRKEKLH